MLTEALELFWEKIRETLHQPRYLCSMANVSDVSCDCFLFLASEKGAAATIR